MTDLSRRKILAGAAAGTVALGASVAAKAAEFGNPDSPLQGAINSSGRALADPGPQAKALAAQEESLGSPPATDVGDMPIPWSSFNLAHKRIQAGGWAREVTTAKAFPVSKDIAGVNMRLGPGGIRELHWHQQAEWAIMVSGEVPYHDHRHTRAALKSRKCKPATFGISLRACPTRCKAWATTAAEFVLAFDNGAAGEFNTLMVTDWIAHTPPHILAQNFGVPAEKFKNIPLDQLWIYQGEQAWTAGSSAGVCASPAGRPDHPFIFRVGSMAPTNSSAGGEVRVVDSKQFPDVSKTVAAALVTVKPGGLRELHWHPDTDEWQYFIKGNGPHDGVQHRPGGANRRLQPGRHGLRQEEPRSLHQEHR